MYFFSFKIEHLWNTKKNVSVKSLKDIGDIVLNVPGIILSCQYHGNANGKDVYCIKNVYGGNEIVGYCSGNIS